jgi:uncharacterized protein YjbI with pentapeptide repeats
MTWASLLRWKVVAYGAASVIPIYLVFLVATLPGEAAERYLPSWRFIPSLSPAGGPEYKSLHEWLIAGEVDSVARKPTSLWSNRLVLPGLDAVDRGKYEGDHARMVLLAPSVSMRARRLERAILAGADLRKADFTGALLTDAVLDAANLEYAIFDDTRMAGARLGGAKLNRASMRRTQLQGAELGGTQMRAVQAEAADMRGAFLNMADLALSNLHGARLDGVWIQSARLDGADMSESLLDGSDFRDASLQGVNLTDVRGSAVDFRGSTLWRLRGRSEHLRDIAMGGPESGMPRISIVWEDLSDVVDKYFGASEKKTQLEFVASLKCAERDGQLSACKFDSPTSIWLNKELGSAAVSDNVYKEAYLKWLSDFCADSVTSRAGKRLAMYMRAVNRIQMSPASCSSRTGLSVREY